MELRNTEMQLRNTVEINKKGVSGIKRGGTITFLVKHNTSNSPYIWIQVIDKLHYLVCTLYIVQCTLYILTFSLQFLFTLQLYQRKLALGEWQKLKIASQVIPKQFRIENSAAEQRNIRVANPA